MAKVNVIEIPGGKQKTMEGRYANILVRLGRVRFADTIVEKQQIQQHLIPPQTLTPPVIQNADLQTQTTLIVTTKPADIAAVNIPKDSEKPATKQKPKSAEQSGEK